MTNNWTRNLKNGEVVARDGPVMSVGVTNCSDEGVGDSFLWL